MHGSRRSFLTTLAAGAATFATGRYVWQAYAADTSIQWLSWQEGLKRAAAERKGIALLVYADWCPHCRELQPVFHDPQTVRASRQLVMIRHNADEAAPWLHERFGRFGTYVPRLFFLHPDGSIAEDIQSGNPRYPYFYQPNQGETMRAAMKRAAALAQKA